MSGLNIGILASALASVTGASYVGAKADVTDQIDFHASAAAGDLAIFMPHQTSSHTDDWGPITGWTMIGIPYGYLSRDTGTIQAYFKVLVQADIDTPPSLGTSWPANSSVTSSQAWVTMVFSGASYARIAPETLYSELAVITGDGGTDIALGGVTKTSQAVALISQIGDTENGGGYSTVKPTDFIWDGSDTVDFADSQWASAAASYIIAADYTDTNAITWTGLNGSYNQAGMVIEVCELSAADTICLGTTYTSGNVPEWPSGTEVGDLVVLAVGFTHTLSNDTTLSTNGWNSVDGSQDKIHTNGAMHIFWKILEAADITTPPTITYPSGDGSSGQSAQATTYKGIDAKFVQGLNFTGGAATSLAHGGQTKPVNCKFLQSAFSTRADPSVLPDEPTGFMITHEQIASQYGDSSSAIIAAVDYTDNDAITWTNMKANFTTGIYLVSVGGESNGIDSYTKLMLHMDGTNGAQVFTDDSAENHSFVTTGAINTVTAQKVFGTASALLDGTTDYLNLTPIPDSLKPRTGDFTFDYRVRFNTIKSDNCIFECGQYDNGILIRNKATLLEVYINAVNHTFSWTPLPDVDYHVAVIRHGSDLTAWVDGVQIGSTATNSADITMAGSANYRIGETIHAAGQNLDGWLDEVRYSNIARETAAFTIPAAAYS